jgi:hypothetical protein
MMRSAHSDECLDMATTGGVDGLASDWNAGVLEAAARVLANNPPLASCQLQLQNALHRIHSLEAQVQRLTVLIQQERQMRGHDTAGNHDDAPPLSTDDLNTYAKWLASRGDTNL